MASKSSSSPSKGKRKIHKVMQELKEGTLKSSSGQKVKSRKQAIAIALSEARSSGKTQADGEGTSGPAFQPACAGRS